MTGSENTSKGVIELQLKAFAMNKNQFSTSIKINWTKIHFFNLTLLAYFYK